MIRKFLCLVAACAVVFTAMAPAAEAQRYRDGYGGHDRHYDQRYRHHRHRDRDNGDAVAAGVVGLIVGLAIGSMASQQNEPRYQCRDNYQRCAPPPQDRYYQDQRYEERYDDRGRGAYEEEYGLEGGNYDPRYEDGRTECTRRERQWDRYANRYVMVDVSC